MTGERPSRLGKYARRAFVLWLLGLAAISLWRGWTLWDMRALLAELGSRLSPPWLAVVVILSACCGAGLVASAAGLRFRGRWGRRFALVFLPLHFVVSQAYIWLFVQSGLLWERRWISLALAIVAVGIGVGALLWSQSRRWLGLS